MPQPSKKVKKTSAAALRYDPAQDGAPTVVAAGQGLVAERILQEAQELNLPIHQDPELAQALSMVELGQGIPPELYAVVAQVFLFISESDEQFKQRLLAQPPPGASS